MSSRATRTSGDDELARTSAVPHGQRVAAHLARRFQQVCLGVVSEVTRPAGLSPLELSALVAIDQVPGIDQRGLAARIAIDTVSASHVLAHLERQGWVDRAIDPSDRRARRVTLTRSGAALRARLRPLLRQAHDRILSALSAAERAQLIDLLARVVESNQPYAKPGNGRRAPNRRRER
jgi:MarR family transcriptional regulator, temperature-dependent positive regulator of motility